MQIINPNKISYIFSYDIISTNSIIEQLLVTQMVMKFPVFMNHKVLYHVQKCQEKSFHKQLKHLSSTHLHMHTHTHHSIISQTLY